MELEGLFLQREELPLAKNDLILPIHPLLLGATLDPELAHRVFPEIGNEWYDCLAMDVGMLSPDDAYRKWMEETFLQERPKLRSEKGFQWFGIWHDLVQTDGRGFATDLSISRNGGGSLFYDEDERHVVNRNGSRTVHFPPEKLSSYAVELAEDYAVLRVYGLHNVDNYHGALFLQLWAIKYLNAALASVREDT